MAGLTTGCTVVSYRWWRLDEIEATDERVTPPDFLKRVRTILNA